MSKDINLLPGEITQERRRKQQKKSFNIIAYIFLGACVLISSIIFLYHFFLFLDVLFSLQPINLNFRRLKIKKTSPLWLLKLFT